MVYYKTDQECDNVEINHHSLFIGLLCSV